MAKQLLFHEQARNALKRGINTVAGAVNVTLGPRGRNVMLESKFGSPKVTHDGVTVALEIDLRDPFENMGARLLLEVATKTNDSVGDGTTTATVIAQSILNEGLKLVAAGANPLQLKRGLDKGLAAIIAELKCQAKPVHDRADIAHVAGISAGDDAIGDMIAGVMEKIGQDGVITVEESTGIACETEYTEGMQIDRGFVSPHFVTNTDRMEAELDQPYILITDNKISAIGDILPILEAMQRVKRNLVIIAEDIDGEALTTLVINNTRGTTRLLGVKAPSFGERRKAALQDIAALTGGTVISEESGRQLKSATIADLGQARRVITSRDTTTLIDGAGDQQAINARRELVRVQLKLTTLDFDREKLRERLAKLSGGVAVLKVGAATESDLKEKKHRIEDALATARAAVEEGIVPGGGVALINAIPALNSVQAANDDERFGVQILRCALEEPLRILARNAGVDGAVILAAVRRAQQEQGCAGYGYNVMTGVFGNMVEQGVLDPVKVTCSAIQNAVSIAGLLLTTETLITDLPDTSGGPMPTSAEQMGNF